MIRRQAIYFPEFSKQIRDSDCSDGRERTHPDQEETYPQHGLTAPNALMRKALMHSWERL